MKPTDYDLNPKIKLRIWQINYNFILKVRNLQYQMIVPMNNQYERNGQQGFAIDSVFSCNYMIVPAENTSE